MDLTARAATSDPQRRRFSLVGAELRSDPDGAGGEKVTFTGYACVTNRSYTMWDFAGEYPETVARGAFTGTLAGNPDVKFLINHSGLPLARTSGKTMTLREDDTGLHVEARLNTEHAEFKYVRSAIERRDLDSMSFAFRILDEGGGWNEECTERTITAVDLNGGDVALVNDPANPYTAGYVSMRAGGAVSDREALAEYKRLARRLGLDKPKKTKRTKPEPEPPAARPDLQTYAARAFILRNNL